MQHPELRFIHRGREVCVGPATPSRTLLQMLREDLRCTSVKEGCASGDCGACMVVVAEPAGTDSSALHYRAVNSCIRLAQSVQGQAVWTAQDISAQHPVVQAMLAQHATQCGFCSPGFVMSLFALYQNEVAQGSDVNREQALQAISGNLCRCTGYRPIVDAALAMQDLDPVDTDHAQEARLLSNLQQQTRTKKASQSGLQHADLSYYAPQTLADLLTLRARWPQAQLVAGCTDVGLWITRAQRTLERVIDISRVAELRRVEHYPHHLAIGAAVTLHDAWAALVQQRPQLAAFAQRFAGQGVRNSGTLGGNVANGSPIGDSMPLLLALGASVVLMSARGHRELLLQDFYTGYRQNRLQADEVLAWIKVPHALDDERCAAYKVSKRLEDDISAVCLGLWLRVQHDVVVDVRIGAGGVAATPVRARKTEAALKGQCWSRATLAQAQAVLADEFTPISDQRASQAYRRMVLAHLLERFWLEQEHAAHGKPAACTLHDIQPVQVQP